MQAASSYRSLPHALHRVLAFQVTSDLASFWAGAYPSVRKDMKGQYPKHFWPEDPGSAEATKLTKKGMEKQATAQQQQQSGSVKGGEGKAAAKGGAVAAKSGGKKRR